MEKLIGTLTGLVGADNVLTSEDALADYSHDGTFVTKSPDIVVKPGSTEEVSAVVRALFEAGIFITARGGGTGLSGGSVPVHGGAVVSLERLTEFNIDASSMTVTTGAGAFTADIQRAAEKEGLSYPPDPLSVEICTIGGNIATNAGGPRCLKYGVTAEYVLGLTVVLADGRVLRLGGRTRKRSSGYRLAQLFVGSEGTLGIVTEVTLRLIPLPRHRVTLLAAFGSVEDAAETVTAILTSGSTPATCELIDRSSLAFVSDLLPPGIPPDAATILLIDQDGNHPASIEAEIGDIAKIARAHGAFGVESHADVEGRDSLWEARRAIGLRLIEKRAFRLPEDVAVPIDKIPEMVRFVHKVSDEMGMTIAMFGHAGDGNLHPSLLFSDREPKTLREVGEAAMKIFNKAIDLGGTVSAEHGLGLIKKEFLISEAGDEAVSLMRSLKQLLDPKGLLNPGKVLPTGTIPTGAFMESLPGWLDAEQ